MERLIMNKLVEWKKKKNRKPLILNGARQVGKTWLLKEFGKLHYEDVAYFMCDRDEEITRIFFQFRHKTHYYATKCTYGKKYHS